MSAGALLLAVTLGLAPQDGALEPLPPGAARPGGWLALRLDAARAQLLRPGASSALAPWLRSAVAVQAAAGEAELEARIVPVRELLLAQLERETGAEDAGARARGWVGLQALLADVQHGGDARALAAARALAEPVCAAARPAGREPATAASIGAIAAILELHRATREPRYLACARTIAERWAQPGGSEILAQLRAGAPVDRIAGGQAQVLFDDLLGASEFFAGSGPEDVREALLHAHADVVARRLWPTGSGSLAGRWNRDREWPDGPHDDVADTCVTAAWLEWNAQLLRLTGVATFAEEMERTAWNHLLAAQHPGGAGWCRFTPLRGTKSFDLAWSCCAAAGTRALALLAGHAVLAGPNGPRIALLSPGTVTLAQGGAALQLRIETRYPFGGNVRIHVEPAAPQTFELAVRVPATVRVRDAVAAGRRVSARPGKWLQVEREWQKGDVLELDLELPLVAIDGTAFGQPGRLAYRRGPVVLAATGADAAHTACAPAIDKERLAPFAEAGAGGQPYRVWLWRDEAVLRERASLLAFGTASASQRDAGAEALVDGDRRSACVAEGDGDGAAWFAVQLREPVTITRVLYRHGTTGVGGGWFDATGGKPCVEVQREPGGAWQRLGVLHDYPDTTATDAQGLKSGQSFILTCEPTAITGVRVIGRGALGADGRAGATRCASCAELEGWR